jgi:hypothetical protein
VPKDLASATKANVLPFARVAVISWEGCARKLLAFLEAKLPAFHFSSRVSNAADRRHSDGRTVVCGLQGSTEMQRCVFGINFWRNFGDIRL